MLGRNGRYVAALGGLALFTGGLLWATVWYASPQDPRVPAEQAYEPPPERYRAGGASCDPKRLNALPSEDAAAERDRCSEAAENHRVRQAELTEQRRANDLAEGNLRLTAQQGRSAFLQTVATVLAFIAAAVAALFAWFAVRHAGSSARADNLALRATRRANREARKDAAEQGARFAEQMAKQQELVEYTAKTAYAMDHAARAQRRAASAMRDSAEVAQETLAHTREEAKAHAARVKEQTLLQDQTMQYTADTARAMRDSARAALRSAYSIPILERAYVHSEVVGEYVKNALHGAIHPSGGHSPEPTVTLRFKNFGRTPATLIHGEVFFSLLDRTPRVSSVTQWPIEYQQVLGPTEATRPFDWDLGFDLASHDAQAIKEGRARLRLYGFLTYLDVFEEEHQCDFGWSYNPTLERMTPDTPTKGDGQGRRRPLGKAT